VPFSSKIHHKVTKDTETATKEESRDEKEIPYFLDSRFVAVSVSFVTLW